MLGGSVALITEVHMGGHSEHEALRLGSIRRGEHVLVTGTDLPHALEALHGPLDRARTVGDLVGFGTGSPPKLRPSSVAHGPHFFKMVNRDPEFFSVQHPGRIVSRHG